MEYLVWLYLATRLDMISTMFGWAIFVSFVVIIISFVVSAERVEPGTAKAAKIWRRVAIFTFLVGFLGVALTPSKKDAMFIAAGVGVIEASKALAGSTVAKKSVEVVEAWLSKELENLKPKQVDNTKK